MPTLRSESARSVEERTPLVDETNQAATSRQSVEQDHAAGSSNLTEPANVHTKRLLYGSHFLSTWNSRTFEFSAFLFLASIYPNTLLPASLYALTRSASAFLFSPALGKWIDASGRLSVVRLSIIGQRVSVAVSCVILFLMIQFESIHNIPLIDNTLFGILAILACIEKLNIVANTISVERDWVVIIAHGNEEILRTMNSQMRRIDLFCKLTAPLIVSFIDSASPKIAIMVVASMSAFSVYVEYSAITKVYRAIPLLAISKAESVTLNGPSRSFSRRIKTAMSSFWIYTQHKVFLPSFSMALLYLTVLSFSGQMITFLLAVGIPSSLIGVLRGVSAIVELSATWLGPELMRRIGPLRSGIWFINWQITCVTIACLFLWLGADPKVGPAAFISAVIASRIGLWGFDLSVQIILQEQVEPDLRGTFSSQESAFQNGFATLSFASTTIFAKPNQFRYPATISAIAVWTAGVIYACFVRARRGHLLHLSRCMERRGKFDQSWHTQDGHRVQSGIYPIIDPRPTSTSQANGPNKRKPGIPERSLSPPQHRPES